MVLANNAYPFVFDEQNVPSGTKARFLTSKKNGILHAPLITVDADTLRVSTEQSNCFLISKHKTRPLIHLCFSYPVLIVISVNYVLEQNEPNTFVFLPSNCPKQQQQKKNDRFLTLRSILPHILNGLTNITTRFLTSKLLIHFAYSKTKKVHSLTSKTAFTSVPVNRRVMVATIACVVR